MSPRLTLLTYRALPATRRSAMVDFFRHRALRLPDTPMPHYTFTHDNHGLDYELFTKIPAPSPIKNKAEAYEQAKMWCDLQNKNWRKLYADWNATEQPLDLFPAYLEPQDCYPVYAPHTVDWVLYWQVNYRVMLPTVRIGREQFQGCCAGRVCPHWCVSRCRNCDAKLSSFSGGGVGQRAVFFRTEGGGNAVACA